MNNPSKIVVEFIPPTHWWKRPKWKLAEPYTSANFEITAPVGFISDGASIPLYFRRLFPSTGKYFGAAIIHDYVLVAYRDWEKANAEFANELDAIGITPWRKMALMFGVRIYKLFSS